MGRGGWRRTGLGLLLTASLAACSARRVVHEVRPGETLWLIGTAYAVPVEEIARANRLRDPDRIHTGQRLVIPGAKRQVEVASLPPSGAGLLPRRGARGAGLLAGNTRPQDAPRLQWPVSPGGVTSGFGRRGSGYHDGIDISAPRGTPIHAAAGGEVVYSASLPGYGKLIVLRHAHGYVTIYGHNEHHHVRDGQWVRPGERIGTVGRSGRTTGTNLHFEVRKDNVPQNPLLFLPPVRQAVGTAGAAGGG